MYESKLHEALLAAAEIVDDHLVSTSLQPEWQAAAKGSIVYH